MLDRRALVVASPGRPFAQRDAAFVRLAFETLGFAVAETVSSDNPEILKAIDAIVDVAGEDDLVAIHVIGTEASRMMDMLAYFDRRLAGSPNRRALVTIDGGDEAFIRSCADRLTRCAVVGSGAQESRTIRYGVFSYALAQALTTSPSAERTTTLPEVVARVAKVMAEFEPSSPALAVEFRELNRIPLGAMSPSHRRPWLGKRVLWVDDVPANNGYLVDELTERGAMTTLALDTEQGLRAYGEISFDAVVTDMGRPGDSLAGYTLIEGLRTHEKPIPIVIFSAGMRTELDTMAKARGAMGSTSSGPQVIQWLEDAFDGHMSAGTRLATQADAWVNHLRFVFVKRQANEGRELEALFAWLSANLDRPETGQVLVAALELAPSPRDFEKHLHTWLAHFGQELVAGIVLSAWLLATRDPGAVGRELDAWSSRYAVHDEARDLLLTVWEIENDKKAKDRVDAWFEAHGLEESINQALAASRSLPELPLKVVNIARKKTGEERYFWEIFLDEPSEVLDTILSVRYILHPTFSAPIRIASDRRNDFGIRSEGWDAFGVTLAVKMRDGTQGHVEYPLQFNVPASLGKHSI